MNESKRPVAITLTYLTKISFSSLNGGESDADNINVIKKITAFDNKEFPYVSSQALRRALRDQLSNMGYNVSPIVEGKDKKKKDDGDEGDSPRGAKHPPMTMCDPEQYIDDDLFGFMNAQKETIKRTSPVRVTPLVALTPFKGNMDFGTNYMGREVGKDPNIYETEIHRGLYRGTILIELDRVGRGEGFSKPIPAGETNPNAAKDRVLALLDAFQNMWSSGRQSRFLADISPKFVAAALMTSKNPIFLEALDASMDVEALKQTVKDYQKYVRDFCFTAQKAVFPESPEEVIDLDKGFETIRKWVTEYYQG
jgi:CRISPR-associated protein Cst2